MYKSILKLVVVAVCFFVLNMQSIAVCENNNLYELRITPGTMHLEWSTQRNFLTGGIIVESPSESGNRNEPVQVVYLIDVSRSMEGEPIKYAKMAGLSILEGLKEGDFFSIVTFSDVARVVFPMQRLNGGAWSGAKSALESIGDEKYCNLSDGIKYALNQFDRFSGESSAGRHVFLLTKGIIDKGKINPTELSEYVEFASKNHNASISTFGIDTSFNEDLLYDIANKTGGRYFFSEFQDEPDNVIYNITKEINRVSKASARNVKLEIVTDDDIIIKSVEGGKYKDGFISLGDMRANSKQLVTFDFVGKPTKQREYEIVATYFEADGITEREVREYIDIPVIDGESRFTTDMAPYLLVHDLQVSLVETSDKIRENRQAFASLLKKNILDIEQENVLLNSQYLEDRIEEFKQLEEDLTNTSITTSYIIKSIKYNAQQTLLNTK